MAPRRSGDDIREAVYDAATDAFATKGLAATTMDDLVQATGSVGGDGAQSSYGEVQQILQTVRISG